MATMATNTPTQTYMRPAFLDGQLKRMLVNGQWVEAASGKTFPVYDPATKVASGQLSHPFVLSQYFFLGNWQ